MGRGPWRSAVEAHGERSRSDKPRQPALYERNNEHFRAPTQNKTTIKVTCHIASSSKSNNCIKQHNTTVTIIVRPRQTKSSKYNMRCRK